MSACRIFRCQLPRCVGQFEVGFESIKVRFSGLIYEACLPCAKQYKEDYHETFLVMVGTCGNCGADYDKEDEYRLDDTDLCEYHYKHEILNEPYSNADDSDDDPEFDLVGDYFDRKENEGKRKFLRSRALPIPIDIESSDEEEEIVCCEDKSCGRHVPYPEPTQDWEEHQHQTDMQEMREKVKRVRMVREMISDSGTIMCDPCCDAIVVAIKNCVDCSSCKHVASKANVLVIDLTENE